MGSVSEKGELNIAYTTFISRFLGPCHVRVLRVDRAAKYLTACLFELFGFVGEVQNFSGTNKSKVEWVEEQQQILVLIVIKRYFLESLAR
jgi:hypothetical protein